VSKCPDIEQGYYNPTLSNRNKIVVIDRLKRVIATFKTKIPVQLVNKFVIGLLIANQ
jgi:hypothetical protein